MKAGDHFIDIIISYYLYYSYFDIVRESDTFPFYTGIRVIRYSVRTGAYKASITDLNLEYL